MIQIQNTKFDLPVICFPIVLVKRMHTHRPTAKKLVFAFWRLIRVKIVETQFRKFDLTTNIFFPLHWLKKKEDKYLPEYYIS